jgi:hypothetical protein
MDQLRLYMLLLGCTPRGRHTEQHDVFFTIGSSLKDCIPAIVGFWPEAEGKIHIDAWREVGFVDGYRVTVHPAGGEDLPGGGGALPAGDRALPASGGEVLPAAAGGARLYFINLGGYKPGEFDEFHYKMVVAGVDKGEAIKKSKATAFYRHVGFKGAESHIDNKYGIDVDDAYAIEDILPAEVKRRYRIGLAPALVEDVVEDEVHLGYFQLKNL